MSKYMKEVRGGESEQCRICEEDRWQREQQIEGPKVRTAVNMNSKGQQRARVERMKGRAAGVEIREGGRRVM